MNGQESHRRSAKHLNESLFSLNVGFAIAYALFAYDGSSYIAMRAPNSIREFLEGFSSALLRIAPLSEHMRIRREIWRSNLIREVVFVGVVLSVALILYLLARAFEKTVIVDLTFVSVSGFAALAAVPGSWFYIVNMTRRVSDPDTFWGTSEYAFLLETTVVGGFIYLMRNHAIWRGTVMFGLHYFFWVFVVMRDGHFLAPVDASVPLSLLFPCSGFAWLRYVDALHSHDSLNTARR
jgi:hypothetical protein